MVRAMIVDDIPLFRCGIRATLERAGECLVVAESSGTDPSEMVEVAEGCQPDVVLVNGDLAGALVIVHLLRQSHPALGILIVGRPPEEEGLFQFVRMGANAYHLRTVTAETLLEAVLRVSAGEYLMSSDLLAEAGNRVNARKSLPVQAKTPPSICPLSSRELEILELVAQGNSNKTLAKALKISDQTVKNHITSLLKKLDVDDRTAAVVRAVRERWIRLEPLG